MLLRILILSFTVLISFSSFALASTPEEKGLRRALFAIDQICGDTWCEGDFNYRFQSLTCNYKSQSCVLKYQAGQWPAEGERLIWSEAGQCKIIGIRSQEDLFDSNRSRELSESVYEQITQCLDH